MLASRTVGGGIHIGTSGWSYPDGRGTWNGVFYPAPRGRGFDDLAYYAEHFDTVEVNSTFYRMPEAPLTSRWVARTPAHFLFSLKLFQKFTHPDMFLARKGVTDWTLSMGDVDLFRAGVEPMAASGKLAAVLLQFPPSFHAGDATRAYLDWLMQALADYPLAVELRHRTWSDDTPATAALLAAHQASWVLIDEPKFKDSVRQDITGGPGLTYMRFHGRNAANWWTHEHAEDRYDYLYAAAELDPFAVAAEEAAAAGKRVVMYLNNHFSAKAPANAAVLKHRLGQNVTGEYPPAMLDRYPELAAIVPPSRLI